jgi:hypothetical protein
MGTTERFSLGTKLAARDVKTLNHPSVFVKSWVCSALGVNEGMNAHPSGFKELHGPKYKTWPWPNI